MATRTVGPNSTYPSITAAIAASGPGDIISTEADYGNESATVTVNNLSFEGSASFSSSAPALRR
jgi:hypothetical protein